MNNLSPRWPVGIKRIALVTSLIVIAFVIFQVRLLIIPILMSMVVAYLLLPAVQLLHNRLNVPRVLAITLVYITLLGALVAIPATITTPLIAQVNIFIDAVPGYVEQGSVLLDQPIELWSGVSIIPAQLVPAEFDISSWLNSIGSVGLQGFNLFGSVASATAIGLGWVIFTLFVSFYMVKDYEIMVRYIVGLVPEEYEWEIYQLFYELSDVWNAFLRGQLILFMVMGTTVFALASIIGLPNALFLGLLAGFAEFVPHFGPILVSIPAILIAFFQTDQSWLGLLMSPAGFALLVGLGYATMNQLAAYFIQPRVLGRSLNIHPLIIFIAALAGALVAGVVGVLLASPMIASGRVIFRYIYRKVRDLPPYPVPGQLDADPLKTVRKRPERTVAENDTSPAENPLPIQGSGMVRAFMARLHALGRVENTDSKRSGDQKQTVDLVNPKFENNNDNYIEQET
ncbi:MAG: putative PurR-regulated permease PerM [Cellvibrionaceae bacterium]|jgi:predicted PurR-regulated permease PerM